ncbi:MAG: YqeG family HAD IIIA-type phosphatase [bacterium]
MPKVYIEKIEHLEPKFLIEKGIQGIIIDLDNTIAPRKKEEAPESVKEWIREIRAWGLKIVLISNSSRRRTEKFAHDLDLEFIPNALKPLPMAFIKASRKLKIPLNALAVVGDQIFTDVLGGNICGAFTVLVSPFSRKTDFFTTKFIRILEMLILKKIKNRKG